MNGRNGLVRARAVRRSRFARRRGAAAAAMLGVLAAGQQLLGPGSAHAACTLSSYDAFVTAFNAGGTITLCQSLADAAGDSLQPIVPAGGVTLDLAGYDLTISNAAESAAGILLAPGTTLTIQDSNSGGTLTVNGGPGNVSTDRQGSGAGIGCNGGAFGAAGGNAGTLNLTGGNVVARGGGDPGGGGIGLGAGIGGGGGGTGFPAGAGGNGGTVNATGGSLTATAGTLAADGGGGVVGGGGGGGGSGGTVHKATPGGSARSGTLG